MVPPPISPAADLRAALDRLAEAVEGAAFSFPADAQVERLAERDHASRLFRDYLIDRLGDLSSPLVVAVFGPTGSGKSTIVNALAGREISPVGVVRPTTRAPVVWCRSGGGDRYTGGAFAGAVVVEDRHPLLEALTLVDTPDLDSYEVENRARAERVLSVADAGVFVTTPQRYADAVPWEVMRRLAGRGLPVTFVMNRLARRSSGSLVDFGAIVRREGVADLSHDDMVAVHEQRRDTPVLARSAVKRLSEVLEVLAVERDVVLMASIDGAIADGVVRAGWVVEQVGSQASEAASLQRVVEEAYTSQIADIESHLSQGNLVRSEVVGRWQRLIGVSDLATVISRGVGRVRDVFRPRSVPRVLDAEVNTELVAMVVTRAQRAVNAIVNAWEIDPAGTRLLDAALRRPGEATADRAAEEIQAWLDSLIDLVKQQGKGRFRVARAASIGVNAAASVLLVSVFAATGGLTGAEVGVVAGTAAAQQTILEHLFGRAAAARLAQRARSDLESRLAAVLSADADRFRSVLEARSDPASVAAAIKSAAKMVEARAEEWVRARSS